VYASKRRVLRELPDGYRARMSLWLHCLQELRLHDWGSGALLLLHRILERHGLRRRFRNAVLHGLQVPRLRPRVYLPGRLLLLQLLWARRHRARDSAADRFGGVGPTTYGVGP
jgi:hypothetical protein